MEKSQKTEFDADDGFIYRTERPWPNPRLKTGAIVGHTTINSATIWFRAGKPGKYRLLLWACADEETRAKIKAEYKQAEIEQFAEKNRCVTRNVEIQDYSDDTTHVERIHDLRQDTRYQYCIFRDNEGIWRPIIGRDRAVVPERGAPAHGQQARIYKGNFFRTLAESGAFSFALFSCHNPYVEKRRFLFSRNIEVERMEAWDGLHNTLLRHSQGKIRPAFLIAGGDQVYTDGRPSISIWNYLYKVMRKEDGKLLPSEGTMLSWFRDIYRGYWGFAPLKQIYSHFPTYMIWDDHEIGDGWGSFDNPGSGKDNPNEHEIYKKCKDKDLKKEDGDELLNRMFRAAKEAYFEYEHSHNPQTGKDIFHYGFNHNRCAFFVLDGRGYRDINRSTFRIHGESQFNDFKQLVEQLDAAQTSFLFVVSAVPVLHMGERWFDLEENKFFDILNAGNRDDLRDGWEHSLHDNERKEFKKLLWAAAAKGIKVAILSGDVHASAAFRLTKDGIETPIWQLTSSAITYHLGLGPEKIAKHFLPASESGHTSDGENFTRHQLSVKSPYSIIQVYPEKQEAVFQLYGLEEIKEEGKEPVYKHNSTARVQLW